MAFTLLEVVIALAILAMIATVIVSAVGGRIGQGRSAAVAQTLTALKDGVLEYRTDIRRYPTNLSYLTAEPAYGAKDLCNQTVPATFLSAWRGPYLKSTFAASGLVVQEMTVSDALELNPPGPYTVSSTGEMVIVVQDVDTDIATELESQFDGNSNLAAGTVRFTAVASGKGTLRFYFPVRGC